MRTRILKYAAVLFAAIWLSSCDDYLDKLPEGDMTIEDVFENYTTAKRWLANTYMHLPAELNYMCGLSDTWARNPFTAGCDEMEIAYGGAASHYLNNGSINSTNSYSISPVWNECFMGVRKANIFLENIDNTPLPEETNAVEFTETIRNQWKGEAYVLRAFAYYQLVRTYGPMPITDHVLSTSGDYTTVKRNTMEECIQFIVDDCDRAIALLPVRFTGENIGRCSGGAAMALKARVLLYAASPIYNGHAHFRDFVDNDGVNLFPTSYDAGKWSKAAQAALDCIVALESAGHKLYNADLPDYVNNYRNIHQKLYNDEWIFWRNVEWYNHLDNCGSILSLKGFSILNPTQEMVDAYLMANGQVPITGYTNNGLTPTINTASGYEETGYIAAEGSGGWCPAGVRKMYANREPRFYASIKFTGQRWLGTTCDFWYTGKDGRKGAGSDYCKTGYLIAKIINPNANPATGQGYERKAWLFMRLAEIYLNYAEAINEAEGPAKAYPYVNRIRARAGIPDLETGLSKDQMREAIHRERRIELAFEGQRYWDVRRWGTAEKTESLPIHSMNIMAGTGLQDDAFYERVKCEDRVFEKKHYWFPIPQSEVNITERSLVQSPGYTEDE
ncbi:MAG: RagB/SusD family nutrient uptake outer membrane protein [Dysgonamonadaceae bacterium]|jgi:hypothetical protein|nr:RagB/SusD family nutrient uptake outer membrane protein [Dysgonamonadaceae bacterium]